MSSDELTRTEESERCIVAVAGPSAPKCRADAELTRITPRRAQNGRLMLQRTDVHDDLAGSLHCHLLCWPRICALCPFHKVTASKDFAHEAGSLAWKTC